MYFETWDAFLLALRERAFERLAADFNTFQRGCKDWVELIGGLPGLFIDLTLSLEGLHSAVFHGPTAQVAVTNPRFNVMSRFSNLIAEGIAQRALQAPDTDATSRFLFAVLHEAAAS